jgi:NAD(P)-dependent dehydrogenase (short-subunit alcohol dehydrogenase family)
MAGVMIVTGAGRGIGAAVARLGAAHGYRVCVNYGRSEASAEALVQTIRDGGGEAIAVQADVSQEFQVERLFAAVDEAFGPVTALVNNAGVLGPTVPIRDIDAEGLHRLFAINTLGYILCAREAVRRMSTSGGGKGGVIINISSRSAVHGGMPTEVAYAATKGAIDSFTIGLAKEVAKEDIRVAGIRPGLILTDIYEPVGGGEAVKKLAPTAVPMARVGSPDEVAEAAIWLCSDQASYITGTTLDVSGGR